MEWMGCIDEMAPCEWGWKVEGDKLVPVMTDKSPSPDALIQMIHCNWPPQVASWCCDRASDSRSRGRGFESRPRTAA